MLPKDRPGINRKILMRNLPWRLVPGRGPGIGDSGLKSAFLHQSFSGWKNALNRDSVCVENNEFATIIIM